MRGPRSESGAATNRLSKLTRPQPWSLLGTLASATGSSAEIPTLFGPGVNGCPPVVVRTVIVSVPAV